MINNGSDLIVALLFGLAIGVMVGIGIAVLMTARPPVCSIVPTMYLFAI